MPFFGVPIRNGLPIGLGSVAGFGVQQFDPSLLFEGGTVPGAWYDPSDLSTMFTTSAGTTPVAMPGGGAAVSVGRILDKSGGGNHAISINDSTARPELRARVNLLERSEEFDNAYWTKSGLLAFGGGSIANATAAPDGTITADLITETTGTSVHTVAKTGLSLTGSFVYSVSGKTNGRFMTLSAFAGNNNFAAITFDLVNGVVTEQSSNGSQLITSAPAPVSQNNGFFRCSVTATFSSVSEVYICLSDVGNPVALGGQAAVDGRRSYTGNGTSGIYIWGADLRPANIGANVPAYQRIADANTYDTAGFPLYLRFDGIDDGMYTPANLNLSATDKVGVFAGVRKLSDAVDQRIVELGIWFSNNGSFQILPVGWSGTGPNYSYSQRGTALAGIAMAAISPSSYAAPLTNVVTGFGDIAGDNSTLRLNGSQVAVATGDQGSGNFGTYPLNIGVRSAASSPTLYFNGHLHGLIVVGSAVSAGNISATESWMAQKTGIVI